MTEPMTRRALLACGLLTLTGLLATADDKKKDDKKPADPPEVTFVFDPSKATKCRTPAEQAQEVVENQSWVCWGAHMADKARHVLMKADGKVTWDPKKTMADAPQKPR